MSKKFTPRVLGAVCCLAASFPVLPALAADETVPADSSSVPPPTQLQTVIVTGSPITQNADEMTTIVDSVNRQQILAKGGANLADALSDVPGVSGSSFAAGASRPVIRGFDANRVRVMEDGIGSFDVSDIGPDHGVPIDPLSARSIEVVRGAGTLRYGSQAIGGVVNSIDNRVPLELPDTPISGDVSGSYGTNSDTRQGAAEVDGRIGQFALHADGFARRANDYDIPGGTQNNSFFRGDGYSGGGSYFFGANNASHIGIAGIHYDAKYGIPSDTTYIDMKQTKELLRSSFAINEGALQTVTVDGGYGDYQHTENEPDGTVNTTFKNKEWDSRAEALFGATGALSRSALGVQLQGRSYSALGEDSTYLFPTDSRNYAAFGFTEAPLSKDLRLQGGARVERITISGTPASNIPSSRDFTPASGSAGLLYDVSEAVRVGLTLSSTSRAPAVTELFARGAHDGPGTYETGDPTLNAERSNSLEGTLRFRSSNVRFDGSVWGAKFSHYIYGALTGRTCDDAGNCVNNNSNELKELNYTQTGAMFYGAEGKSTIGLYEGATGRFEAELLADYVHATLDHDGGPVPRITPYHLGSGINWDKGNLGGGVMLKYTGARRDVATAETPTGGFGSLDAQLRWNPLAKSPDLQLLLVGRNLTNHTERNAIAFNKDDVVLPGRDIRLTISKSF